MTFRHYTLQGLQKPPHGQEAENFLYIAVTCGLFLFDSMSGYGLLSSSGQKRRVSAFSPERIFGRPFPHLYHSVVTTVVGGFAGDGNVVWMTLQHTGIGDADELCIVQSFDGGCATVSHT